MRIRSIRRISEAFRRAASAGRAVSAAAAFVLFPALAHAVPQPRTFVSAKKGNDSAACSRTAPCRTFARAIAVTTAGGEVIVLDSGGYGSVTINGAVSLEAPDGVYAGITVSAGDGVTVAAGASDTVVLRGLTLVGAGTSGNGITVASAGIVHVEKCTIRGFATGNGIFTTQGAFQHVYVEDSVVSECDVALQLAPAPARPTVYSLIYVRHSRFENSQTVAMALQGTVNSPVAADVFISDTDVSGLGGGVTVGDEVDVTLDRCHFESEGLGTHSDFEAVGIGSLITISNSMMPNIYRGLRIVPQTEVCLLGNNFIANITGPFDHCPLQ